MDDLIRPGKYSNHSVFVNQRNISITYTVAACLSRVADAEWLRSVEDVRRFSPLVGQLGEWRSLCEGGWMGALPEGLPDLNAPSTENKAQPPHEKVYANEAPERESGMEYKIIFHLHD